MRPGDRLDLGHGGHEIGTREPLEQRVAPSVQGQPILLEDQCRHVAQQERGIVKVAQASQPGFLLVGFGILDQVGEQRFGQFGRVILGGRLQRVEQRRHGRRPAWLLQGGDRRGFSRPGDPRQPFQAGRRDTLWRCWTQIEGSDRLEPVEVEQEFAGGALPRHGPQSIQCSKAGLAGLVEQCRDPRPLLLVERRHQALPKALLCTVPDAADEAFQDGDAGQQHLVDDQPGRGALDQRAGMVIATPAQGIQPAGQAEPGPSVVGKLGEAVALTDEGQVPDALAAVVEIALEPGRWLQPQLVDQERRDRAGDVRTSSLSDLTRRGCTL